MSIKDITQYFISDIYRPVQDGNVIYYEVPSDQIVEVCQKLYHEKGVYLRHITATDEQENKNAFSIYYIFSFPKEDCYLVPYINLIDTKEFPSLSNLIHESTYYEREIYTFFGLTPLGHTALQPIILHANWPKKIHPLLKDYKWNHRPETSKEGAGMEYIFQEVQGDGIYEIPVGPVHAGIIEPGHFRFSVAGEEIVNLEPMLGYVHKGSEKLFEILPLDKKIKLSERISGDSSFSHSLAFCQAVESLTEQNVQIPERAKFLRVVYAELERIANHVNDIGFIMNDTGYSFGGSNGTRLREIIMSLNEELTGSRFLRGVNTIGGVTKDIVPEKVKNIVAIIQEFKKDFKEIIYICDNNESVTNRLKGTGVLEKEIASDHGVVGVPARASGLPIDIRFDHPYAGYRDITFEKASHTDCDVYARYQIRVQEVLSSLHIIQETLHKMPSGSIIAKSISSDVRLKKSSKAISMVEGWRGDILYFVMTDSKGNVSRVAVRDPSFLNWPAVPYAVMGNIVPDFPLINKSFNLSYSGNDR
ncbi:MAG: NADH-quinone oxidoreductase subunit C [Candidatus Roizmanbacteria bacterium]